MKVMPEQKPGRSKQDYGTPDDLFQAITKRFGYFDWDLAATAENSKCVNFITPETNSLTQPWYKLMGNLWLNPPYGNIEPWARHCSLMSANGARVFMLVPASVGSDWYRDYVEPCAYVLALSPRITFVGCDDPYPKDCILACYLHGLTGFKQWRWK